MTRKMTPEEMKSTEQLLRELDPDMQPYVHQYLVMLTRAQSSKRWRAAVAANRDNAS